MILPASPSNVSQPGTPRPLTSSMAWSDGRVLRAGRLDRHDVARAQRVRRDVDLLAVDQEVSVAHELPRLRPRGRQTQPVDDVVEAALEQLEQRLARDPARAVGGLEVPAELVLEHAVDALDLLLLAQLHAVAGKLLLAGLAVLSRREVALLDRALVRVAALALQEQLHAFTAAKPARGPGISSHSVRCLIGLDFRRRTTRLQRRIEDPHPTNPH